jgi:hypothetical protein
MSDDIAVVTRALNKVTTYPNARVIGGKVLTYLGTEVYPVIGKVPSSLRTNYRKNLDIARYNLEEKYKALPPSGKLDPKIIEPYKQAITKVYSESAAIWGAASYTPQTSFVDIFADEAKAVVKGFTTGIAKATNIVGEVVGSGLSGLVGGLGIFGIALVVGLVIYFTRKSRA